MLADFHFIRPWWLLAIPPMIGFIIWFARPRSAMFRWQGIVEPQLMPHVLVGMSKVVRSRVTGVLSIASLLLIVALAGPTWERLPQPVFRSQSALVIALDASRSMDIADVKPSRLGRARFKIADILERRGEGQTALLVYAAEAYVVSPLTDDVRTIASQLPALSTELMPNQGSRADRALRKAADLLRQASSRGGHVLLITDDVNPDLALPAVAELRDAGIRTSVLGVGTPDGGPIPGEGGFVKGRTGAILIEKLEAETLAMLANQGGGAYEAVAPTAVDIERLLADVDATTGEALQSDFEVDVWRDEGPWLLLPLLPLVAFAFRRGVIAIWLVAFMLPAPRADAFDWADLWTRPDQRAMRVFESGDPATAAGMFEDPAWRGAAKYRAGRYGESLAALEGLTDTTSSYNRGNVFAMLGRYDAAIDQYNSVLETDPDHEDARFNRDLLLSLRQQEIQAIAGQGRGEPGDTPPPEAEDRERPDAAQGSGDPSPPDEDEFGEAATARNKADEPGSEEGDGEDSDEARGERDDFPDDRATRAVPVVDESVTEEITDDQETPELADNMTPDERSQAAEQWLRKIPDDPGGLLRRKFYYQYQQQTNLQQEKEKW